MRYSFIIKPTDACNLNCRYCYNSELKEKKQLIQDNILESIIKTAFEFARERMDTYSGIDFIWHGGEPMLMGIPFFQTAWHLQKTYAHQLPYSNIIQTNGTLINKEWLNFFKVNRCVVSISLDGPQSIHDAIRTFANQAPTFALIMNNIQKLKNNNIDYGAICVMSKLNINHATEIFNFFVTNKIKFHFVPLTKLGNAINNYIDLGITPNEYADVWIKMYDQWLSLDAEKYTYCREFIQRSKAILSGCPQDCVGAKNCSLSNFAFNAEGNVYPCATLSGNDKWTYGNIQSTSLATLLTSDNAQAIIQRSLPESCQICRWKKICHGGCFSRSLSYFDTINKKDYYCAAYRKIYQHIANILEKYSTCVNC